MAQKAKTAKTAKPRKSTRPPKPDGANFHVSVWSVVDEKAMRRHLGGDWKAELLGRIAPAIREKLVEVEAELAQLEIAEAEEELKRLKAKAANAPNARPPKAGELAAGVQDA